MKPEAATRHMYDLKVEALMSIGHPGEIEETVPHTRDWLLVVQPEDFDVTIITTYPGTPYYDYAVPDLNTPAGSGPTSTGVLGTDCTATRSITPL